MNETQALIDGMAAGWQKERTATQMTLGQLIAELEGMPSDLPIKGLGELKSYRGYYCDLSFDPCDEDILCADLLESCREAMGRTFQGYKGGDFLMGETTPLWVANYGCCGERLISLSEDGTIKTEPEDD